MQKNIAETDPAFQQQIDGSLELLLGLGRSKPTLHFHLLVQG